jgi:hypothetical protein
MDNVLDPTLGPRAFPVLSGTLGSDMPFPMLAVEDISAAVAQIFAAPASHLGQRRDLAGDVLSLGGMRDVYQRLDG